MANKNKPISFPFFGAGFYDDAYYSVIFYMRFKNEPTLLEKKEIISTSPTFIQVEDQSFYGRILEVRNTVVELNPYIEGEYGNPGENNNPYAVSKTAARAFEKRMEQWIISVHHISPIQFAIRFNAWNKAINKQDMYHTENIFDNEGPLYANPSSGWHKTSVKMIPELLDTWEKELSMAPPASEELSRFCTLMEWILGFGGQMHTDVPAKLVDFFFSAEKTEYLFRQDFSKGLVYYQANKQTSIKNLDHSLKRVISYLVHHKRYADILLLIEEFFEISDPSFREHTCTAFLCSALIENRKELIQPIVQKLSNQPDTDWYIVEIDSFIYNLVPQGTYATIYNKQGSYGGEAPFMADSITKYVLSVDETTNFDFMNFLAYNYPLAQLYSGELY